MEGLNYDLYKYPLHIGGVCVRVYVYVCSYVCIIFHVYLCIYYIICVVYPSSMACVHMYRVMCICV